MEQIEIIINELGLRPVAISYRMGVPVFTIIGNVEPDGEHEGYKFSRVELPRGKWNRSAVISAVIRMRYSADDVEAIINNLLNDPFNDDRQSRYKALQEWRIAAKQYATELMAWAEDNDIGQGLVGQEEDSHEVNGVENIPDGMTILMQGLELLKKQAAELPDEEAVQVPALFPAWECLIGESVEVGKRLFYGGRLWKVIQAHTVQAEWTPDVATSLFAEVAADQEQGTIDNPIPYNGNMALEEGKYYTQGGVVYLCIRDTVNPVYNDLSALVGLYVQIVE